MDVERLAQQVFGLGRLGAVAGQVLAVIGVVGAFFSGSAAVGVAIAVGALTQGLLLTTVGRYVQMKAALVAVNLVAEEFEGR